MSTTTRNTYGYYLTLATRWMDNDVYGHVNNVTYYSYFDTAANSYLITAGGLDIHNDDVVGFVVASNCEYHAPVAFPDTLDVGVRVNQLSERSVEYGIGIFKHGAPEPVAQGTFTHVFVSRASGAAVAIPPMIRAALIKIQSTANEEPA